MKIITSKLTGSDNTKYLVEYCDADNFDDLPVDRVKQAYGVCFFEGKLLIGFGGMKKSWGLVGGSVEEGETYEQTLIREIKEESNTEVLSFLPIGYQKVTNIDNGKVIYQLRYVCKVKPYGEFVIDGGDGMSEKGITEIKFIDPADYKKYFDWGEIGERIIKRAEELLEQI